jgi:hypothetical protein
LSKKISQVCHTSIKSNAVLRVWLQMLEQTGSIHLIERWGSSPHGVKEFTTGSIMNLAKGNYGSPKRSGDIGAKRVPDTGESKLAVVILGKYAEI